MIHRISVALSLAILCSTAARADIIDIAWNEQGRFERRVSVAPGKFAEVCGKLARADSVAWRFKASGPLNFNIHYHEGKKVVYPARQEQVSRAADVLPVKVDQTYCWMWTNKTSAPASLKLELQKD